MPQPDRARLFERAQLTHPDYLVYVPSSTDPMALDSTNEHFLVFDGPDGSLMTIWTQSWQDPATNHAVNHTMFARSEDEGQTWSPPKQIAGPKDRGDPTFMTSWAFPMVSRLGRIYVIYNAHKGVAGWVRFHTGSMAGITSDDNGVTWSAPQEIPIPVSPYDDPEAKIQPEWIVWQKPMRDLSGGYFVGFSHWINRAAAGLKEVANWTQIESVIEFIRFTNIDQNPEPCDLDVRYSAPEKALRAPSRGNPLVSVAQEPSLIRLPDQRLFCVLRSGSGYIWWSQSHDDGATWCSPRPLLDRDFGRPLLNPVASDPIYPLSDGRFILFYHNNPGGLAAGGMNDALPREPVFAALGEFRPNAEQPVWFSPPKLFISTGGICPDGVKRNSMGYPHSHLSLYTSFTNRNGVDVLWYPENKFYLLGKRITPEWLFGLAVPAK